MKLAVPELFSGNSPPRHRGIPHVLGPGDASNACLNQTNNRRPVCSAKGSYSPCSVRSGLVFLVVPKSTAGFQHINVQTEVANSEIAASDNVWVPAAGSWATLLEHVGSIFERWPSPGRVARIDSDN